VKDGYMHVVLTLYVIEIIDNLSAKYPFLTE